MCLCFQSNATHNKHFPVGGMGSLFKVREWWSTKIDDEFDRFSLVVGNIDNSADDEGKFHQIQVRNG